MTSLGRSSKWPSCDSLRSTPSFLHSESEQTEDEADASSDGEGDGGVAEFLRPQIDRRPEGGKRPDAASSPGSASSLAPGDFLFAQKSAELQRFIPPLLGLLHGLKTGRFDKGLSSFQKTIAIDRFQRILGILQRPERGGKYLQNLLQIEVMLKIWFPQVPCESTEPPSPTSSPRLQPRWRQNQLHMPIKKRKLSWSSQNHSALIPTKNKQPQHGMRGTRIGSTGLPGAPKKQRTQEERRDDDAARSVSTAGSESDDATGPPRLRHGNRKHPEICPRSPRGVPAAQDGRVSSSDSVVVTLARIS
ncbi:circadian associated repressor of transcription a [Brachionichthys hirsutus]|uniref:circadian associated repressor of transcription a n=1 Tax=Brachionichthys hirsutus TaxID=412623 RepID=UPI003604B874